MTITETFLLALALVMGLPWLVWRLLRTDNWAPLVVVQIVAGVLLGPGVLGVALPHVHDFLFPPGVIAALNGIAWWAVMIFVWLAGIELDLHQAWVARRETWTTAGLALVTPLVLGALAAAHAARHTTARRLAYYSAGGPASRARPRGNCSRGPGKIHYRGSLWKIFPGPR